MGNINIWRDNSSQTIVRRKNTYNKISRSDYRLTWVKKTLLYGLILFKTNSILAVPPVEIYQNYAQDSSKITVRKPLESKMSALRKIINIQPNNHKLLTPGGNDY